MSQQGGGAYVAQAGGYLGGLAFAHLNHLFEHVEEHRDSLA